MNPFPVADRPLVFAYSDGVMAMGVRVAVLCIAALGPPPQRVSIARIGATQ